MASTFDFPAWKRAFEAIDVEDWLAFFAPDAQWWESRPDAPPRPPNTMIGREAIRAKMTYVAGAEMVMEISDEVIGDEGIAFFWVTRADGRPLIEHTILHLADHKIKRQVDVKIWD